MKLLLGGLLLVAACGEVHDNTPPDAPRQDVLPGDDADPDIDAAPPAPRCDPSKPFGAPVRVDELDITGFGADEMQATLSPDELTIWFSSNRAGGLGSYDIWKSTRATKTATWGAPVDLAVVNTSATESHPSLSADQLTLFASYQANPNSPFQVVRATRATNTAAFSTFAPVTVLDTIATNYEPYVLPDQSAIYFTSNRSANGDNDLYVAQGVAGSFQAPTLVSGATLSTTNVEDNAVVTPDQLTLYFRSNRSSQFDVWLATRTAVTNAFGTPVNLTAVNTTSGEVPSWISADNCVLYFTRALGGAGAPADNDLWFVTKPL